MTNYIVNGANRSFLDNETAPNVGYWLESDQNYYTNESHLVFIVDVGSFSLDVPAFIETLKSASENENIDNNPVNSETDEQISNFADIPGVIITDLQPNETVGFDESGNLVNRAIPDFQTARQSADQPFSTTGSVIGNNDDDDDDEDDDDDDEHQNAATWVKIDSLELTTKNTDVSMYHIQINFLCLVTSNNRAFEVSVFVNSTEQTHITQELIFNRKNDVKSITILDCLYDVAPGSKITIRVKKSSNNSTTLKISRRTLAIQEVI